MTAVLLDEWRDAIERHQCWLRARGRSVKTAGGYSWAVRRLAASCYVSPWLVDRPTIERCLHDPTLEPNGRRSLMSGVRSFYAWALSEHLVDVDPAADLRPTRQPAAPHDYHPVLTEWEGFQRATASQPETIRIRVGFIRTLMQVHGLTDPLLIERRHVLTYLARDLSPWTQRSYHSTVEAWERWLRDFGYWPEGKVGLLKGIPRARMPEPIARPIEDEVVRRLLASTMRPRTRAYVLLALYGALRVHEIAKVRGDDFDLQAGWMRVTGKGRRAKTIPVHPELIALALTMPREGYWFPSHADSATPVNPRAVSAQGHPGHAGVPAAQVDPVDPEVHRGGGRRPAQRGVGGHLVTVAGPAGPAYRSGSTFGSGGRSAMVIGGLSER